MSGSPVKILEQAVRPIGAIGGNTGAPCKAFQSQAKRPSGQKFLHDHKALIPELNKDQLNVLTWQDEFLKLVDEVESSGVDALSKGLTATSFSDAWSEPLAKHWEPLVLGSIDLGNGSRCSAAPTQPVWMPPFNRSRDWKARMMRKKGSQSQRGANHPAMSSWSSNGRGKLPTLPHPPI